MKQHFRAALLILLTAFSLQGCGWVAVGLLSQSGGGSGGGGGGGGLNLPPQVLTLQVTNTPDQSRATDLSAILLNFNLIHPTGVPADVLVEFSTDGENFSACDITTIIADQQTLPAGVLTDLPTSSTGVEYTLTWTADQGNLTGLNQISLRVTATNAAGSSIPAVIDNILVGNDAPIASALQISNGSAADNGVLFVSEIVILEFELNDSTRDPTNIIFEFVDPSVIDDPNTPENEQIKPIPAEHIIAGQSTNLLPDLPGEPAPLKFNLVWESVSTVGPFDLNGVRLRITPTDNLTQGQGVAVETAPFVLLNNQPPVSTLQEPAFTNDDTGSLRIAYALGDPEQDGVDIIIQFATDIDNFPPLEDILNIPEERRKILLDPAERRRRNIITPKLKTLFQSRSTLATTGSAVNKVSFFSDTSSIDPATTLTASIPNQLRTENFLKSLIGSKLQILSSSGGPLLERTIIGFDSATFDLNLGLPLPQALPRGTRLRFRESVSSVFLAQRSSQQGQVGEVAWNTNADLGLGFENGLFLKLTPFSNLQRGQSSQSNFPVRINTSSLNLEEVGVFNTNQDGTALATADLDLDGDLDLVLGEFNPATLTSNVRLLMNNGEGFESGSFTQVNTPLLATPVTKEIRKIVAADIDGDGRPDIVFSDNSANVLVISGNDLASPPATPKVLPLGGPAPIIEVKDVDDDGFLDVAALNVTNNSVTIFFGSDLFFVGTSPPAQVTLSQQGAMNIESFRIADLDQDEKLDVVLAERSNQVLIFLNDGGGRFGGNQAPPNIVNAGGIAQFLLIDVTNDKLIDLVYIDTNGTGRIAVSPGDGAGSFLAGKQPPSFDLDGKMISRLKSADLNGDGFLDLIGLNRGGNNLSLFLGIGRGEFRESDPPIIRVDNPEDAVIADFDSNEGLDLVVCTGDERSLEFLANDSKTPFELSNQRLETESAAARIQTTDINADGVPDVVVLARRLSMGNQEEGIRLFVGAGNANYQPPFSFDLTDSPQDFAITDLGNDGVFDAIVLQDTSVSIVPLSSTTAANTSITTPVNSLPAGMSSIALGDFNQDNLIDAVVCNRMTGVIAVIPGTSTTPFFGAPITVFTQANSNLSQVQFADINQDGALDIVAALPLNDEIKVLFNDPSNLGDFSTLQSLSFSFPPGAAPNTFRLADFNSDGHDDILVSDSGTVSVILSTGAGSFDATPRPISSSFDDPDSLSVADMNGDGFQDVLVADSMIYRIFLGQGDGRFILGSPAVVETNQMTANRDVLLVDLNGDGDLDFLTGQGNNVARIYLSIATGTTKLGADGFERSAFPTLDIQNNPIDRDITPGQHIIDTDAGTIDGEPIISFSNGTFFFENLNIQDNAIVEVVGRNPLRIRCRSSFTLAGTLSVSGFDGGEADDFVAGLGGAGGPGAGPGGDGAGFLRRSAGFFQLTPSIDGQSGRGLGRGFAGLRLGDTPGSGGGGAFADTGGSADGIPGQPYSNQTLFPLFGGSGGAGGSLRDNGTLGLADVLDLAGGGGGGGGGLVHIVAETVDISGSLFAQGGKGGKGAGNPQLPGFDGGHGGGGSGGAILIQARQTIEFTGTGQVTLNAKGGAGELGVVGTGNTPASGAGKDGFIRLEDQDNTIVTNGVTIDPAPTTGFFVDTPSIFSNGTGTVGTQTGQ